MTLNNKFVFLQFSISLLVTPSIHASTVTLGRSSVTWPDFGDPAGTTQVQTIHNGVKKLSDNSNSRFEAFTGIANSQTVIHTHNFGVVFSEVTVLLYSGTHPNLTRILNPQAAGWTIAAGSNPLTQVNITAPSTGGPHTFAALLIQGSAVENLDDLDDVDATTSPPEDGQALVYTSSGTKWVPGASGDSSLKCQSVAHPNLTLKNGYLLLDSGIELQVASDLTVNLNTVLGSSPANATAYYFYVDLDAVSAPTILSSGRQVRVVSSASHFSLQTVLPDAVNTARYVPLCVIKSATTGTVWSGSGASFATLATRRHGRPVVNVNPTVYELAKQSIGTVGKAVVTQQAISSGDFSGATAATSVYSLASAADSSTNGRNLTNNGSTVFQGEGFYGRNIVSFDGINDSLSSTNSHFNPGDINFSTGGWFKVQDPGFGNSFGLFGQGISADRSFGFIYSGTDDILTYQATNTSGTFDTQNSLLNISSYYGKWVHLAITYTASTDSSSIYFNGLLIRTITQAIRAASTANFVIGSQFGSTNFFKGSAQDFFFSNGVVLNASEINNIYSRRFSGPQIKAGHILTAASFPSIIPTSRISYYNLSSTSDASGNTRTLTANGNGIFTGIDLFGNANTYETDGTGDNLQSTDSHFTGGDEDFTFGIWYRLKIQQSLKIISGVVGSVTNDSWFLQTETDNTLRLRTSTGGSLVERGSVTVRNPYEWNHIVLRYDSGANEWSFFVNGQFDKKVSNNGDLAAAGGTKTFTIGANGSGGSDNTNALYDEFFFARSYLDDADIKKIYSYKIDHNTNVITQNQQWFGQFSQGDNSKTQNELDQDWIINKTANSLFLDSNLNEDDYVSLRLQNQSFTTTVVPIKTYTTGKLAAAPTFPLVHSLGTTPKDFYVLIEGASESGKDDKRYDLCSADATNVNCDLSSLTIDSSHRIEIIASAAPIAVSVPVAGTTTSGIVSTSPQTFGGIKTFDRGVRIDTSSSDNPTLLVKNSVSGGGTGRLQIESTGTGAASVLRFVPTGTGKATFQLGLATSYSFENSVGTETVNIRETGSASTPLITIASDAALNIGSDSHQTDAANMIGVNQGGSVWGLTVRNTNAAGRVLKVVGNSATVGDEVFAVRKNTSSESGIFYVDPFGNTTIGTTGGTVTLARNTSEPTLYVGASSGAEGFLRARGADVLFGTSTNHPLSLRTNSVGRLEIDANGVVTHAFNPSIAATIATSTSDLNSGTGITPVIFDSEEYDVANNYNPATGVFTVPVSGKYLVQAHVAAQVRNGGVAQDAQMILRKNGGTFKRLFRGNLSNSGFTDQVLGGSCVVIANAGDTLDITFVMDTTSVTTASWRIVADGGENYLMINKIQ